MFVFVSAGAAVTAAEPEAAETWTGFLSDQASQVQADKIPLEWSPTKNIAWQAEIPGYGQSSPVVWGSQVFVTSVEGPQKETNHVVAFDLKTGEQRWKFSSPTTMPVKSSLYVSRAAPTPAVDEKAVYVFFESGDLIALTHKGERLWQRSLSEDYGKFVNKFGLSASPCQTDTKLFVLVDDEGPSYLLGIDKKTGETIWKADRGSRVSWSSPAVVQVGGKPVVVVSSAGSVDAYNAESGELLSSYSEVGGNTVATPVPFGENSSKFLTGASAGRDGENTESAAKSNLAMQVVMKDGQPSLEVLFRAEKATSSFGSPLAYRGQAYWINRQGVVFCYNLETGEQNYAERIGSSCWASPFGVGDRVYFPGKDGTTVVLQAGPEFKKLAENQLWDPDAVKIDPNAGEGESTPERRRAAAMFAGPTQYGVAIVSDGLLLRTGNELFCLRPNAGK